MVCACGGVVSLLSGVGLPGLFNDHFARLELCFQSLEELLHHVVGEIIFVHRRIVGCDGAAVTLKLDLIIRISL